MIPLISNEALIIMTIVGVVIIVVNVFLLMIDVILSIKEFVELRIIKKYFPKHYYYDWDEEDEAL